MSKHYDRVLLVGNIETELILRKTKNGTAVTNFTLTTTESWINKSGETQKYKKWHHIVCWGHKAEEVVNNFKINDTVKVKGSLSYRHYEKDNKSLKVAEIKATDITMWDGSLNEIILIGNVGSDLSLRKTTNNTSVTNFALNTVDTWKNKNNETRLQKKWHRAVCWGKTAEHAVSTISSGSQVLLEGSISYKTYVNAEGVKNNHIAEIKASKLVKWSNSTNDSYDCGE